MWYSKINFFFFILFYLENLGSNHPRSLLCCNYCQSSNTNFLCKRTFKYHSHPWFFLRPMSMSGDKEKFSLTNMENKKLVYRHSQHPKPQHTKINSPSQITNNKEMPIPIQMCVTFSNVKQIPNTKILDKIVISLV